MNANPARTDDLAARFPNASASFLKANAGAPVMGVAAFAPFPTQQPPRLKSQIKTPPRAKEPAKLFIPSHDDSTHPNTIRLVLPFPISANNYWRTRVIVPKSRARPMAVTYVTNEARAYKNAVGLIAAVYVERPFECELKMIISLFRPRKIGDTSNYVKVLEDALEGTCYVNDSQIGFTQTERFDDKENPRVEVLIGPR